MPKYHLSGDGIELIIAYKLHHQCYCAGEWETMLKSIYRTFYLFKSKYKNIFQFQRPISLIIHIFFI